MRDCWSRDGNGGEGDGGRKGGQACGKREKNTQEKTNRRMYDKYHNCRRSSVHRSVDRWHIRARVRSGARYLSMWSKSRERAKKKKEGKESTAQDSSGCASCSGGCRWAVGRVGAALLVA